TNGQSQPTAPTNVVEAPLTPPSPQVEVVPVAPGPEYVWVPGYWAWSGGGVWVGGRWGGGAWASVRWGGAGGGGRGAGVARVGSGAHCVTRGRCRSVGRVHSPRLVARRASEISCCAGNGRCGRGCGTRCGRAPIPRG